MSGHGDGVWNHPEWSRLLAAFHASRWGSAERREVCLALADAAEEAGDRWFADAWRREAAAQGEGVDFSDDPPEEEERPCAGDC